MSVDQPPNKHATVPLAAVFLAHLLGTDPRHRASWLRKFSPPVTLEPSASAAPDTVAEPWARRADELLKCYCTRPEVIEHAKTIRLRKSEAALCEAIALMAGRWKATSIAATRRKMIPKPDCEL
jgi:hypothetical protein